MVCLSGAGLPRLSWKTGWLLSGCSSSSSCWSSNGGNFQHHCGVSWLLDKWWVRRCVCCGSRWVLILRRRSSRRRQRATTSFTSRTWRRAATSTRRWSRSAWATPSCASICSSRCRDDGARSASADDITDVFSTDRLRRSIANRLSLYDNVSVSILRNSRALFCLWSMMVHVPVSVGGGNRSSSHGYTATKRMQY